MLLGLLFFISGCGASAQQSVILNISAASSLQESLTEIAQLYMEENHHVEVRLNFAGSNVLKTQVAEGFDVDIFLSAHVDQYTQLQELGMVAKGDPFTKNDVVLISSSESVQSFGDIANEGVRLIFANATVPIGIYTEDILAMVEVDNPGFRAAVEENVISRAENVRQVLTKVSIQEGDAAFVYRTDITEPVQDSVTVIELPEEYQVTSDFYIMLVERNKIQEEAISFYQFILSEAAQQILANHGFQ